MDAYFIKLLELLFSEKIALEDQIKMITELNEYQANHPEDPDLLYLLASHLLSRTDSLNLSTRQSQPQIISKIIDIVGTGGDGHHTLNFSTLSAFLVSKAGYPVAKHGNKSATSRTGSFDFLMALGIPIPKTIQEAEKILEQENLVFLFAPYFHPILTRVKRARDFFASKNQKTIFNLLGPLINPMRPKHICVGVYQENLVPLFAKVLIKLGVQYAYVVFGNGLDEFNLTGPHRLIKIQEGKIQEEFFNPQDYGIHPAPISALSGGDLEQNLKQGIALLKNQLQGPKQDMLILNTAGALRVASEFTLSWEEALILAKLQLEKI